MTDRPLPKPALKDRRDETVQLLCEHYAQDRLELSDFESRLDQAHRASSLAELDALLSDLPVPAPRTPAAEPARSVHTSLGISIRATRTLLAFMGGVERRGRWKPARKNIVVAIWGGALLDFREVDLPPGETEVFVFAMMGGAEIIVPPGLAVDASGIAIMGGFEHASAHSTADSSAPVLRINGVAIMGGVEIIVRHPGESAKDARQRDREERRELRDRSRNRLRDREE
jgi:hypothetical protein